MLKAFFDESGTHAGSPFIVVAGYVSMLSQWAQFEREWREVLTEYGILKEDGSGNFHMTDFENRSLQPDGVFSHIDKGRGNVLISKLVAIINRRVHTSIGVVIPISDYNEVICTDEYRNVCGSPYSLAVLACITLVGKWAESYSYKESVYCAFEDRVGHKFEILDGYDKAKQNPEIINRLHLDGIVFCNKKKFLPLQAADMFAYEVWKNNRNHLLEPNRPDRRALVELAKVPHLGLVLHKDNLKSLIEWHEGKSNGPSLTKKLVEPES